MIERIILTAATAVVLSGCSLLSVEPKSSVAATTPDMSGYFEQRLEDGRKLLAAEQPSRAIEAFRQASYDTRHKAEALNGMAVAYTMLGRNDVAERLFERAIEADPFDPRFSRNLARLNGRTSFPAETSTELAMTEVATETTPLPVETKEPQAANPRVVISTAGTLKPFHGEFLVRAGAELTERVIRTRPDSNSRTEETQTGIESLGFNEQDSAGQEGPVIKRKAKQYVVRTGEQFSGRALKLIGTISRQTDLTDASVRSGDAQAQRGEGYHVRVRLNRDGAPTSPARTSLTKEGPKRLASSGGRVENRPAYPIRVKLSSTR